MPPRRSGDASDNWGPHYLGVAKPVYPQGRSAPPLLHLKHGALWRQ
jgi:hypothetical protein